VQYVPVAVQKWSQASSVEDQIAASLKADRVLGSATAATNLTVQLFIFSLNNLP
jgi:hypothetical protein